MEHKDVPLVMLPAKAKTSKPNKPCISLESLFFSCRVSLAKYNRVLGDRRLLRVHSWLWKPSGGLREDSFHAMVLVLFITLTKGFIRKDVKSASVSCI